VSWEGRAPSLSTHREKDCEKKKRGLLRDTSTKKKRKIKGRKGTTTSSPSTKERRERSSGWRATEKGIWKDIWEKKEKKGERSTAKRGKGKIVFGKRETIEKKNSPRYRRGFFREKGYKKARIQYRVKQIKGEPSMRKENKSATQREGRKKFRRPK